jgi:hypothetical protein
MTGEGRSCLRPSIQSLLLQAFEISTRRRVEPASADHRLGDERHDVSRPIARTKYWNVELAQTGLVGQTATCLTYRE